MYCWWKTFLFFEPAYFLLPAYILSFTVDLFNLISSSLYQNWIFVKGVPINSLLYLKWIGAYYTPFTANGYRWVHWQFGYMIAEMDGIFCAWAVRFRRESYRSRYASSQKTPSLLHVRILRVFPLRIAQTWRDFVYLKAKWIKIATHLWSRHIKPQRYFFFFLLQFAFFLPNFWIVKQLFSRKWVFFWKKFPE